MSSDVHEANVKKDGLHEDTNNYNGEYPGTQGYNPVLTKALPSVWLQRWLRVRSTVLISIKRFNKTEGKLNQI